MSQRAPRLRRQHHLRRLRVQRQYVHRGAFVSTEVDLLGIESDELRTRQRLAACDDVLDFADWVFNRNQLSFMRRMLTNMGGFACKDHI